VTARRTNAGERYGFVATFETAPGEFVTAHRRGRRRSAMLAELVDDVLARWPDAMLVCYSTPETILTDLRGRRAAVELAGNQRLQYPEAKALAAAGRPEVLAPVLAASTPKGQRRRERRLEAR
jgi:hypothetical protein